MISLINLLKNNWFFYRMSFVILTIMMLFLFVFSRVDGFIILNLFHTQSLLLFFNAITFLGDGIFTIITSVILFVFFKKHRALAFLLIVAYLFSGLFAQIIKVLIHAPRPIVYFQLTHFKYHLDTFSNSRIGFNSFPSGHSTSVFAMITIFSIYCNRRFVSCMSLTLGILVGYSRVYLAHHFLIDVFAGAVLGLVFGSLSYLWYNKYGATISRLFILKSNNKPEVRVSNHPSLQN